MSGAAPRPVSPARPQETRRSGGLLHKRVVVLINLNAHRPAAAASPTGSGITAMSSPRTTVSARGCRSTSSTSCRRRRATARAARRRAPTARAGMPWAAAPRASGRARSALCLYIYLLTTYYYGTYSLRRRRWRLLGGLRPRRPRTQSPDRTGAARHRSARARKTTPDGPRRLPRCALKAHCIMCIM